MSQTHLILVAAALLLAAFALGWLAGWLTLRAGRPAPPQAATPAMTEAEADALQAELREARIEIEELRAYIDRRLLRQRDGGGEGSGPAA